MTGRADGEQGMPMRQLTLYSDESTGGEDFDRAEVIPLREGAEEPRPARGMRRAGGLLTACGLALLPWLYVLATGLPATATAEHWPVTRVGPDPLAALGLLTPGLLAAPASPSHALAAAPPRRP